MALVLSPWARSGLSRLRPLSPILVPLAVYSLALALSVVLSINPKRSVLESTEILSLVTVPLAALWVRRDKDLSRILNGFVVVASICATHGLLQFAAGFGGLENRIRGPFSHYMTFAGVLLLADSILLAQLGRRELRWSDWRWPALVLVNAALLGSLTRSAWVALAISLVVLILIVKPKSLYIWLPVVLVAMVLLPEPVRQRMVTIVDLRDPSNYDRLSMMEAGLDMLGERPFFGLGPGMAEELYPIYRPLAAPRHTVQHLHNTFLQLAAEQGLVGLGAYLWMMWAALDAALRGFRRHAERRKSELCLASFVALCSFNFAGFFEANWLDTEVQRVALLLMATPFLLQATEQESERVH